MTIKFKYLIFITIFVIGFTIVLKNIDNLNLDKQNIELSKTKDTNHDIKHINKKSKLSKNKIENASNEFFIANQKSKYSETIIIVKKGQTFSSILDNFNISNKKRFDIINSINKIFNLRDLRVKQKIYFLQNNESIIKKIIIELDFKTNLIVDLESNINVFKKEFETYSIIESKEYFINDSLYGDGIKNNIPNSIIIKLIQLFSFDLDFQRDIRKGTLVSVSYEKIYTNNKNEYSFGNIDYAKITINNKSLEYFKFMTDEGFIDYFNKDGKNVKKSLLKTPLDGAKLSSNFGMRKHPISGFNKMHKGIDFAAPMGTPVYAGGNGIVERVGVNGGYGKYIKIRHNNEYKTAYAHLSGFKKGISKGVRVNQGDIIGYVGSTGKSTGPHLHYEIIYKNKQINPLTLKLPSGKILEGKELNKFKINYKTILATHLNNLFE